MTPRPSDDEHNGPYTFGEARVACRESARLQKVTEDALKVAFKEYAQAEEAYRVELAKEIVRQHADEGVAWSTAPDLARGNERVAKLRYERDVKEGVREATQQAAWRRSADRKDAQRFSDWSMRRELAEGYGQVPEPEFEPAIGSVRAS